MKDMDPACDVVPLILSYLTVDNLIALAQTTTLTSVESKADIWNDKLVALGYDRVPCAQGLHFLVVSLTNPITLLTATVSTGVIEHVTAVMKRHNLTKKDIANNITLISQRLTGAVRELAIGALREHYTLARRYINYPNTYDLLGEFFDKNELESFAYNITEDNMKKFPTLVDDTLTLCEKYILEPPKRIITDPAGCLTQRPLVYMLTIGLIDAFSTLSKECLESLYTEAKALAESDPTIYTGSFLNMAYVANTEQSKVDMQDFWSRHLLILMELPYFYMLYTYLDERLLDRVYC